MYDNDKRGGVGAPQVERPSQPDAAGLKSCA